MVLGLMAKKETHILVEIRKTQSSDLLARDMSPTSDRRSLFPPEPRGGCFTPAENTDKHQSRNIKVKVNLIVLY